jgi:hypothetical protein
VLLEGRPVTSVARFFLYLPLTLTRDNRFMHASHDSLDCWSPSVYKGKHTFVLSQDDIRGVLTVLKHISPVAREGRGMGACSRDVVRVSCLGAWMVAISRYPCLTLRVFCQFPPHVLRRLVEASQIM